MYLGSLRYWLFSLPLHKDVSTKIQKDADQLWFAKDPCPKEGSPYPEGLEHAELVVGQPGDDMCSAAPLEAFMRRHAELPARAGLEWQTRDLAKSINPDVSIKPTLRGANGLAEFCIKFHARPLYEVARHELSHGLVTPVGDV